MAVYDFEHLQNGSDIRGIATETDSGGAPDLTERSVARLAKGFLLWLSRETEKAPAELCIAVGRDSRISGNDMMRRIANAFVPFGVRMLDCGLATTPAMFMSTVFEDFACDGSVMITASHMSFERNGLKFFTRKGGLEKSDISKIIFYAESDSQISALGPMNSMTGYEITDGRICYPAEKADLMSAYSRHLRELIILGTGRSEKPLEGLSITIDAGNGSGGFYARDVLEPLGADISSSQFLEPDGMFPNHIPNPENAEAMKSIRQKVIDSGSDLGIMFDTDVDRSAAVARGGREISRNAIVALAAAITAKNAPGTTVVTDSVTSDHLTDFIESLGLKHCRFKRGYRNVINKAIELNAEGTDSALAIETSGHCAMRENYFMDDGAYLATRIIIEEARMKAEGGSVSDLISDLIEPASSLELRLPIKGDEFREIGGEILEKLESWADGRNDMNVVRPNHEGVRVSYDDGRVKGWFLLRMSLHEPLMPLNVESDGQSGCDAIMAKLRPFLSKFDKLEI